MHEQERSVLCSTACLSPNLSGKNKIRRLSMIVRKPNMRSDVLMGNTLVVSKEEGKGKLRQSKLGL